jgi:hypothetical protein
MYAAEGKALSVDQVAVIILTGIDLGLTPSQALRGIKVIKGQPSPSADTLIACVRRRHDVCEYIEVSQSSPTIVQMAGKRPGDVHPTITQFTIEDARMAGLTTSQMYTKYPEQMLYARCAVKLVRRVWPDVALGLYTPDELTSGKTTDYDIPSVSADPALRSISFDAPLTEEICRADASEVKEIIIRIIDFLEETDEEFREYVLAYMDHREWTGKIQDLSLDQLREYDQWIASQVTGRQEKARVSQTRDVAPTAPLSPVDAQEKEKDDAFFKEQIKALNDRLLALAPSEKSSFRAFAVKKFAGVFRPIDMDIFQIDTSNKALDQLVEDPFTDLLAGVTEAKGHGAS